MGAKVDFTNYRESDVILEHLKRQKKNLSLSIKKLALDGGYDAGSVHRGLELLGIDGYTAICVYQNNALKKGFRYDPGNDLFLCGLPYGGLPALSFSEQITVRPDAGQLVVLFELCRGLDSVLCFPHAFRSANNSSRSV